MLNSKISLNFKWYPRLDLNQHGRSLRILSPFGILLFISQTRDIASVLAWNTGKILQYMADWSSQKYSQFLLFSCAPRCQRGVLLMIYCFIKDIPYGMLRIRGILSPSIAHLFKPVQKNRQSICSS